MISQSGKTQIFLVDDHPIICQGLQYIIEQEADLRVCGFAHDFASALKQFDATEVNLAIVDISLPGRDGIELIRELLNRSADLPILVVSYYPESDCAPHTIRAGARGYLCKREAAQQVVSAIRTILRGRTYLSEILKDQLFEQAIGGNVNTERKVSRLTPREFQVFRLIGVGKSTRTIADQLNLSPKTVEMHRIHIKRKLDVSNVQELTCYAAQWIERTG